MINKLTYILLEKKHLMEDYTYLDQAHLKVILIISLLQMEILVLLSEYE